MLSILYEDEALLAVDKPSGLLSVPGKGPDKQDCVIARLIPNYPDIRCIHRLDRDTSGILLLGRTADAQRHVGYQFETRQVRKRYEALVFGHLTSLQGEIDLPLAKDFSAPPRHRVDFEHGKIAKTNFQVICSDAIPKTKITEKIDPAKFTRLSLAPHTGRSHQLRVHLAAMGHPILGDPLYACSEALAAAPRLMLHACELEFAHPGTGEQISLTSTCPF